MHNKNILIFNCGSSSLNYKVFQTCVSSPEDAHQSLTVLAYGKAHRVGVKGSEPSFIEHHFQGSVEKQVTPLDNHRVAAALILDYIHQANLSIDLVGHRFVHGGSYFQKPTLLTPQNQPQLEACQPLAPLQNPNSVNVIHACQKTMPGIPQYISFDTAFHATLPAWAYTYPLPVSITQKFGLRKYGFHGLSYHFISSEVERYMNTPLEQLRVIACHLGTGGSSVAAIQHGQALDTSMGYTPLPGLMMSTRTGDIDPSIPLYLMENGVPGTELNDLFNKKSGLGGISGFSSDIRDIIKKMNADGDSQARLAVEMYTYRLKKYIGAYAAVMGGLDVLVFTDDIGVQSWLVRQQACEGLVWCGIEIDDTANQQATAHQITQVSSAQSAVKILTIPPDEEFVIGMEGIAILQEIDHAHL